MAHYDQDATSDGSNPVGANGTSSPGSAVRSATSGGDQSDSDTSWPTLDHGHSHGHAHDLVGGWAVWRREPTLVAVLFGVAVALVATVVGLIALWPDGSGRTAATENAADLGLTTQRLSAVVDSVVTQECSYGAPDDLDECVILSFVLEEGPEAGSLIALPETSSAFDPRLPDLTPGQSVVLGYDDTTDFYFFADVERRAPLVALAVLFVLVVLALGRWRGVLALLGMSATLAVLVGFVAPSVLDGHDPILVCVVAASLIAFVSLYLTHGFSPTTTVALAGTLMALALTLAIANAFFGLADFTGLASEEALILPFISAELQVSSLLLGGAVIGALGALDDVTVTQVATVAELHHRNPTLSRSDLVTSGIRVGREHIASTVNTLLLAYAGASMPLLLLFAVSEQSLSTVANSELIAIEIVRTLCGSIGLVAAVPITTTLAALVVAGTGARGESPAATATVSTETEGLRSAGPTSDATADARSASAGMASVAHPDEVPTWEDFAPKALDDRGNWPAD